MKRLLVCCALSLPLAAVSAGSALAEVKTKEKGLVKFEGVLGGAVRLFGGKAAREGVVTTTAVKGDRKATIGDNSARIVDLSEEKVYELDMKKKTYTVQTFDEIRKEMREAQEKAEREANEQGERQEERDEPAEKSDEPAKEYEVDFDVKETGAKKTVAGYETRQVIMTVTVREKGKTLEEGGGLVTTSDVWMGPAIPAMKELAEFEQRYWTQLAGPELTAVSAEQMAAVFAMFPGVKQSMERLQKEGRSADGTALQTRMTVEAVKSPEQMAQQPESDSGGGGLGGMLARKMMKRKQEPKARALVMTVDTEVQEVSTSVDPADLAIPAGFKQKS